MNLFDIKKFSSTLKKYRVLDLYTQKDLASRVEVSYATIIAWEKGNSTPNINQFLKLASIFNVDYSDLYFGRIPVNFGKKKTKHKAIPAIVSIASAFSLMLVSGFFIYDNYFRSDSNIHHGVKDIDSTKLMNFFYVIY